MACDVARFQRFFHGMLAEGVYLARRPSRRFVSSAHGEAELEHTWGAAERVLVNLISSTGEKTQVLGAGHRVRSAGHAVNTSL